MNGKSVFFFWPGEIICYKSSNGPKRNGWELWADLSEHSCVDGATFSFEPEEPCVVLSKALPGDMEDHRVVLLFVAGRVIKYVQNVNYNDPIWFKFP